MPAVSRRVGERGALAIVLHTHMPYVEGFGTWPFGEEWLWEAIAVSYLPLLSLLRSDAPLTLSLTPVLCDQLEAPGLSERFQDFVQDVRRLTHEQDAAGLRAGGHERLARELERSWSDYALAAERLEDLGGELLGALGAHAQWTSSATHAILPLLATDAALRLQVQTGVDSHARRCSGHWRGGFWLPECAYAPWLGRALEDAGVRAACVELTNLLGLDAPGHLAPIADDAGVVLVPIDRATVSLVWSEAGYPAADAYRDYHHHTIHHHNPWNNGGGAYDHAAALALAREHAADFVARVLLRLRRAGESLPTGALPGGGLVVCALDTELLGHWWYEGPAWLAAVVQECSRQGLELLRLDDALERLQPIPWASSPTHDGAADAGGERLAAIGERACSWGKDGDLSTWSGPAVADMAFAARAAELQVVAAGASASAAAVRELLALQASDWPFMVSRRIAAPYARERFHDHRAALASALAGASDAPLTGLRNLAVDADPATLLSP
ncbi:MAG TPA: 1,4-alpha-glucan branching protein domain-containing protein [Solirubrobacteraceae bacterium]|nr:1,4-alpha-glucan branching protein domain-containing protein [Solirubrobacteraceae bacterium]